MPQLEPVEIPNRSLFRQSEVCEIAKVQPYVLLSWEAEFPDLGAAKTEFLTSNGETDRVKGNETQANWCHIGGEVEGQFAGVTIMGHPENFRAPQPMRLHPTEPFFCFAPSQAGDWQIEQSKPYVSRYRFVVTDGRPNKTAIDEIWKAYARPPRAVIEQR